MTLPVLVLDEGISSPPVVVLGATRAVTLQKLALDPSCFYRWVTLQGSDTQLNGVVLASLMMQDVDPVWIEVVEQILAAGLPSDTAFSVLFVQLNSCQLSCDETLHIHLNRAPTPSILYFTSRALYGSVQTSDSVT